MCECFHPLPRSSPLDTSILNLSPGEFPTNISQIEETCLLYESNGVVDVKKVLSSVEEGVGVEGGVSGLRVVGTGGGRVVEG